MFKITLPSEVQKIITLLQNNGFEAFIVGGCVRDNVLKEKFLRFKNLCPKDWDIATSAKPLQIIQIFQSNDFLVIPTGIQYGTISVVFEKQTYEITTYRTESSYKDYRKPEKIEFCQNLQDDLARRDFTINAMAYHPDFGLIDPYDGLRDLENGIIRAVGIPSERFLEDALRILRALRFGARFCFEISAETKEAIFTHKELLTFISKERILKEFEGILCAICFQKIAKEYREVLMSALDNTGKYFGMQYEWDEILAIIKECNQNALLRLLALLSKTTPTNAHKFLKNLKYDNKSQKTISELLKYIPSVCEDNKYWIKRHLYLLGEDNFRIFLDFKIAQSKAKQNHSTKELKKLESILCKLEEIIRQKEVFSLKDLAINGDDIKNLGIPEGKNIQIILEHTLNATMQEKIPNTKEDLINFIKTHLLINQNK